MALLLTGCAAWLGRPSKHGAAVAYALWLRVPCSEVRLVGKRVTQVPLSASLFVCKVAIQIR